MTNRDVFFQYLRQRAANIRALGATDAVAFEGYRASTAPEQLLLATSAIEALSGHWARAWGRPGTPTRDRLVAFLDEHGDVDVWSRVALPPLLRYAAAKRPELIQVLNALPGRHTIAGTERAFRSDPTWSELVHALFDEIGLVVRIEDLEAFRYPCILYKHYRNPWVHELNGAGGRESLWARTGSEASAEPRYDNMMGPRETEARSTRRVLVLPPALLVKTLEHAIDSMDRTSLSDGVDPTDGLEQADPWGMVR